MHIWQLLGTERNPFFENVCTYLGRIVILQKLIGSYFFIEREKNSLDDLFTLGGNKILLRHLASSKGPNPLLPTFKHVNKCRLTCSLGCTFCTWHFTSSSSVKRKLKTLPEGQDIKQFFFGFIMISFHPQ